MKISIIRYEKNPPGIGACFSKIIFPKYCQSMIERAKNTVEEGRGKRMDPWLKVVGILE